MLAQIIKFFSRFFSSTGSTSAHENTAQKTADSQTNDSIISHDALELFLNHLKSEAASHSTVKNYASDISQFITVTGHQQLNHLFQPQSLEFFFREQEAKGLKLSSIQRKFASIKQFAKWLEEHHYLDRQLITQLPFFETPTPPPLVSAPAASRKFFAFKGGEKLTSSFGRFSRGGRFSWVQALQLFALALFSSFLVLFGYRQFFSQAVTSQAYPEAPVRPSRVLSFQGRLTDSASNPITTATNVTFKLFNADTNGTELWNSGTCSIDPDQDGIFNTLLGSSCGSELGSDVFTENQEVWLEVTVGAETLSPRQQIATVAYALNAETLQGFPINATESATVNTVAVMNEWGEIVLGEVGPKIKSVSGNFTLQGESMTLQTASGSNGDITISPDGTGSTLINSDVQITSNALNSDVLLFTASDGSRLGRFVETAGGHGWFQVDNNAGTAQVLLRGDGGSSYIASGNFGIGDTTPASLFTVGNGDLFQVNSSGALAAATGITSSGTITFSGLNTQGGVIYAGSGGQLGVSAAGTNGQCLVSAGTGAPTWGACGTSSTSYWNLADGALSPINSTADLLVGGTATSSAKFAILNVNGTRGSQTASISGSLALDAAGSIQTTNNQTLTIGGNTTGNISFTPGNTSNSLFLASSGNVGLGTTSPATKLHVVSSYSGTNPLSPDRVAAFTNDSSTSLNSVISIISGTAGVSGIDFGNTGNQDEGGIFYYHNDDHFEFRTNGVTTPKVSINTTGYGLDVNTTAGFRSTARFLGAVSQTAVGSDRLDLGVEAGTPRIVFEDAGNTIWLNDNNGGTFRWYVPGYEQMNLTTSSNHPTLSLRGNNAGTSQVVFRTNGVSYFSGGNVGIGDTTPSALFTVGSGDLFQVNSSGAIAAATGITSSGTITFSGLNTQGGVIYAGSGGQLGVSAAGTSGQCLLSAGTGTPTWGSCADAAASSIIWQTADGTAQLKNSTLDLLVGGTATTSAKFAILNVNGTRGTQTASVSGSLALDAAGSIQTTRNQLLTIGGDTTGDIQLSPRNGSGTISIGTTPGVERLLVRSTNTNTFPLRLQASDGSNLFDVAEDLLGNAFVSVRDDAGTSQAEFYAVGNAGNLVLKNGGTTTAYIGAATDSYITGGKLGIGTASPAVELDVLNATSPEFRLSKDANTYFKIENKSSAGTQIADVAQTGEALLDFDPVTTDGTSKSSVRLFRSVNTTNTGTGFSIYAADGTSSVQSFFSAKGNSYFNALAGNMGIGDTTPSYLLTVGNGDLFGVNSSGAIAAATGITSSGTITFSGLNTQGGVIYAGSGGQLGVSAAGTSGQCLQSAGTGAPTWGNCASSSQIVWQESSGTAQLKNSTLDLLVGGQASSSAKFAILNVNGTRGTQVASVSGSLVLDAAGSIQSTRNQTLTVGGSSTGNIVFNNNSGYTNATFRSNFTQFSSASGTNDVTLTLANSGPQVAIDAPSNNEIMAIRGSNGRKVIDFQQVAGGDAHGILNVYTTPSTVGVKLNASGDSYFSGGNVGIGTGSPSKILDVFDSAGGGMNVTSQITGSSTSDLYGMQFNAYQASTGTNGNSYGIKGGLYFNSSGGASNASAGYFQTQLGASAPGWMAGRGVYSLVESYGGGDYLIGMESGLANHSGNTIGYFYGMSVGDITNNGTITNTYGVFVGDITAGTQTNTPYSFYASDANAYNYFAGRVGIGTVAPTGVLQVSGASNDTTSFIVTAPNISSKEAFSLQDLPLSTGTGDGKAFQIRATGESFGRVMFYSDGALGVGPGSATRDVFLSRSAANTFLVSANKGSGNADLVVTDQVGIGSSSVTSGVKLAVTNTTEQLRLGYDGSNYASFLVNSSGALSVTPTSTLTLNSTGDMTLDGSGNIILDADGGNITLKDGGTTFATMINNGTDLELNIVGGNLVLADSNTINIGGGGTAYFNAIGNAYTNSFANDDNDLYIQDILEVGNALYVNGQQVGASFWNNTSNVIHPIGSLGSVADLAIGGTSTASAKLHINGTTGEISSNGSSVIINDDLQIKGGDILGNLGETRITIDDSTDKTLISGAADVSGILRSGSSYQFQVAANGNISTSGTLAVTGATTLSSTLSVAGDLTVSTIGSSMSGGTPRVLGFSDLSVSDRGGRFQFGDAANAIQNGYDRAMDIYAYHSIRLVGDRGTTTPLSFSTLSNVGVQVLNTLHYTEALQIMGASGQTANLTNWVNSSGTTLASVDASGNFSTTGTIAATSTITSSSTITGATLNATSALQTGGTSRIDSSGNLLNIRAITSNSSAPATGDLGLYSSGSTNWMRFTTNSGDFRWYNNYTNGTNGAPSNNLAAMALTNAGRLIIGGDQSTGGDIEIRSSDQTNGGVMRFNNLDTVVADNQQLAALSFYTNDSSSFSTGERARLAVENQSATYAYLDYVFYSAGLTSTLSEVFRVGYNGQIYAGTLGSSSVPSYTFKSDSNTGIYSASSDLIQFTAGGSNSVNVNGSGIQFNDVADGDTCSSAWVGTLVHDTDAASNSFMYFCRENSAGAYTWRRLDTSSASSPDLAEYAWADDVSIEGGDLVAVAPETRLSDNLYDTFSIEKANVAKGARTLGIVSSDPGIILNKPEFDTLGEKADDHLKPLTLAGRVPVKIVTDRAIMNGDRIGLSDIPGAGQKMTRAGQSVGMSLTNFDPSTATCTPVDSYQSINWAGADFNACYQLPDGRIARKILVMVNNQYYYADLELADNGELLSTYDLQSVATDSGTVHQVVDTTDQSLVTRVSTFAELLTAQIRAGLINAQEIIASIGRFSTRVESPIVQTDLISPLADSKDVTVQIGNPTASEAGELIVENQTGETVFSVDENGTATLSGELNATSARVKQLEARMAELNELQVETATVSGQLYLSDGRTIEDLLADNAAYLATQSATPSEVTSGTYDEFLSQLTGASDASIATLLAALKADKNIELTTDDVILNADGVFIHSYLGVQGLAEFSTVNVAGTMTVGGNLQFTANSISSVGQPLEIQPTGVGSIKLLAGLMTLSDDGQVLIDGDLTVTGRLAANEVATNTIQPNAFGQDLQVQLASQSAVLGQTVESQLSIVNQNQETVAAITASGSARFKQLTTQGVILENDADEKNKTAGQRTLEAGQVEMVIDNNMITDTSLIYITPTSNTQNQVLFVKSKEACTTGGECQKSFTVGINEAVTEAITFNYWIVNVQP